MGWTFRVNGAEVRVPPKPESSGGDEEALIEGEVMRGVRDELIATFTLETSSVPALGRLQDAVEARVRSGAPERYQGVDDIALAGWHGGWQDYSGGLWVADIFGLRNSTWHWVGRASLTVRLRRP